MVSNSPNSGSNNPDSGGPCIVDMVQSCNNLIEALTRRRYELEPVLTRLVDTVDDDD